ncbi:MAG: HRDC domain-containing protein [Methylococcales bacterium]
MRLRFFTISAHDPEDSARDLNEFLASNRILEIERHFVAEGGYWAICVSYTDSSAKAAKPRIDYKETLDPQTFTIFSRLREIRKVLAERDSVPAYAVFTNDQLAEMAKKRVSTLAELRDIAGVGETRAGRYGNAMLKCLLATKAQGSEN